MKREALAAVAVAIGACAVGVACGDPAVDKTPKFAQPMPSASAEPPMVGVFTMEAGTDVAPPLNDAGPPPPSFSGPLPPAKPTTIPLSTGDDSPGDKDLAAGDAAFEKGAIADAGKRYEAARAAAPKRAAPLVGIARVRIAKLGVVMDFASSKGNKEIIAAVAQLRDAVKLDADFGPARVELGRALLLLGDADGSIESLRRGVQLMPNEAEAHSTLGVALLATGHGEESMNELGRAAQLDPGSAARHGNYGTALFMRGRVKEAVAEYEIQVRLSDGDARAHSDLGTALLGANDVNRAVRELQRAVQIDPKRATFHSNLGYALQIQGKLRDAIAEYQEALRLDDKLVSAWVNLATALARDPKTRPQARAALERAKKIDPTDPSVRANLAELDDLEKDAGAAPTP